jgi:hypothetical protein
MSKRTKPRRIHPARATNPTVIPACQHRQCPTDRCTVPVNEPAPEQPYTGYRNEQRGPEVTSSLQQAVSDLSSQAASNLGSIRTLLALLEPVLRPAPATEGAAGVIVPGQAPSGLERALHDVTNRIAETQWIVEDAIHRLAV